MQTPGYKIIAGAVIAIVFFLLLGFFFFLLVAYLNRRKKRFIEEKLSLQAQFNEQLMQSRLEIQQQTFSDISQEIHDNVGQLLSVASIQLTIAEQQRDGNLPALQQARESLSRAMTDLRQLARGLNAGRLHNDSLAVLIQQELDKINQTGLYNANINVTGAERDIQPQQKLIIFRMLQESLQNIIRHAAATQITVRIDYSAAALQIKVTDNGQGFVVSETSRLQGIGLRNIIKRADLLGGTASIESSPGEGTTIIIFLPYAG